MPEDEYINIEDIDKHQRQEKIKAVAEKVSSGARATGQFLWKGVKDLGSSVKHVATEHIAAPIKAYAEKAPERAERAHQRKLERMEKAKEINAHRIELAQQRKELESYRPVQRPMPQMPSLGGSMFGGGMGGVSRKPQAMPSFDSVFKMDPWKASSNLGTTRRVKKHRVKHHKRRAKRKTKAYVVVNNIRYYKK